MNTSLIRFSLITLLFFGSVCVIDTVCYLLTAPIYVWAGIVLYIKLIKEKKLRKIRHLPVILLLFASAIVSIVINFSYNILENIFMLYYMAICFFLFYGLYADKTHEGAKREMTFIFKFLLSATTALMIISIIILLISKEGFMFNGYYISIKDNRFVGIFTNANLLAFYAVIGVILCHILYLRRKAVSKVTAGAGLYYAICMLVNLLSLFLSDSNASLVFIIIYVCFTAFYKIFRDSDTIHITRFILRVAAFILSCVVFAFAFMTVRSFTQRGFSELLVLGQDVEQPSENDNNYLPSDNKTDDILNDNNNASEKHKTTFTHENKNFDSGRIPLLKQAAKLFMLYPVFGVTPRNIVLYGELYLGGLKYSDFHNGFVTVLVSFGIVGFTFFMIFAVKIAKSLLLCIFKKRNKNDTEREMLPCLLAFLAAYCIYSMFEITLLLDISYKVLIFWLMLGYAMSYLNHYETNDARGKRHRAAFFPGSSAPVRTNTTIPGADDDPSASDDNPR